MKIQTMLLGLALMAGVAFAQNNATQSTTPPQDKDHMGKMGDHHRGDRKEDMQEHMNKMATELNLTADQKTQVQGIMQDGMQQTRAIKQDSSLSEDQKEAKIKELHEATHTKINGVLTADQQQKFAAMQKDMRHDRREDRREKRHKHGEGNPDKK